MRRIRIGLLGCGTVGEGLLRTLTRDPGLSARFEVPAIAVRDVLKHRGYELGSIRMSGSVMDVVTAPDVDVVVEAIGGTEPARVAVTEALQRGVPVITANPALVGAFGPELRRLADQHDVALRLGASVAAGLPIVRTLRDLERSDRILKVDAVLNGTSNFVLSAMSRDRVSLDEAVARVTAVGHVEADTSRALDGSDVADKLAVLAQLLWDRDVRSEDVQTGGVQTLSLDDVNRAAADGQAWRLVASATEHGCLVVEPRKLPIAHPLAQIVGSANGIVVRTRRSGVLTFTGPSAGGDEVAAAILRDLMDATALMDLAAIRASSQAVA